MSARGPEIPIESFPAPERCTACDCVLEPHGADRCGACGHSVGDDRGLWRRWELFLEITRRTLLGRWLVLGLWSCASLAVMFQSGGAAPPRTFAIVAGVLGLSWLGGRYFRGPGLRARTMRRAWMLAGGFGAATWAIAAVVIDFATMIFAPVMTIAGAGVADVDLSEALMLSIGGGGVFGTAAGVVAFRSTLRLTGLRSSRAERRAMRGAMSVAWLPQVVCVLVLLGLGLERGLGRMLMWWV